MEINTIKMGGDIQKAVLEILLEKGIITQEEIKKKVMEYNNLTEEQLDKIVTAVMKDGK